MTFGQKLRKLRIEKGLTQLELANKLGYVNNSYIAEVEKGKFIPSKKNLRKIARVLNVTFSHIEGMLVETKIEGLGIKEPELINLVRDLPKLSKNDKISFSLTPKLIYCKYTI